MHHSYKYPRLVPYEPRSCRAPERSKRGISVLPIFTLYPQGLKMIQLVLALVSLAICCLASGGLPDPSQKPLYLHDAESQAKFITNGTVLSFDEREQQVKVLENASILIIGNTIKAIFNATDHVHLPRGTEIIQARGKIVTPGFVNTHMHLWQGQYKTLGSNTTLAQYILLYSEFSQAQTVFSAEDIYYGQMEGIYESLNAGVTTIVDHASHTWSTEKSLAGFRASIDSGARIQWCFSFHDLTNGYARSQQYRDFERLARRRDGSTGDWRAASLGIAYDNFQSDPPDEVQRVLSLARYDKCGPLAYLLSRAHDLPTESTMCPL